MGGKTTVARVELPQDWPVRLADIGVKLHQGVREDEFGNPINVYSPEIRIPFAATSGNDFSELINHIASALGGEEAVARYNFAQKYATVSINGTDVEIHPGDGEIAVRGAREFSHMPDSEWEEGATAAIDDAEDVSRVAKLAQDFLAEPKRLRRVRYIGYA